MATGADVLHMLCSESKYVIYGDDYDSINWISGFPAITKEQFISGFAQYDAWKADQDAQLAADKAALLAKLGITADEAKLLLSS